MKISKNYFFLVLFLLSINLSLIKSQSKCPFTNIEDLMNYYAKGVIPNYNHTIPNFWDYEDYKWESIHCINGYSRTTYLIKENGDEFFKNSGIFIGSSIDIGKLKVDFIYNELSGLKDETKYKLANLTGKYGDEAEKIYNSFGNFTLESREIDIINRAVYSFYLSEMENYYNMAKIKTFSLEICILTFFAKFYKLENYLIQTRNCVDNEHIFLLSYYLLTIKNKNYIQNKLWSLLAQSSVQIYFNYHHIGFYIDSRIHNDIDRNNTKQWLKTFVSMNRNQDNLYTIGNYSGIILNEEKKSIYNYSSFSKIIDQYSFHYESLEDINKGIEHFENILEYNNDIFKEKYYQRHLVIICNPFQGFERKIQIDKFKEKGINVIFLFKITNPGDFDQMNRLFDDKFNRIPFYYYEDLNKYNNISLLLNGQINLFVEPFYYKDKTIKINNIRTMKRENIQCFKIMYDNNLFKNKNKNNDNDKDNDNEEYYFHVSLKYNNDREIINTYKNNANITFYISDNNPYAGIHNYTLINFCLNNTVSSDYNKSPFINYRISDENSKNNYFYIIVVANDIEFSLRIELLNMADSKNFTVSNGLFGNLQVQPISSESVNTFSEKCIQKECNVDYISLVKYFTSGIHFNYVENDDLFDKLFDYNLFGCLYKNYFCPFFNIDQKEAKYDEGPFIGYGIDLSNSLEMDLYTDYVPLYVINKLYPFLLNSLNVNLRKETLEKYNLVLTYGELYDLNLKYLRNMFSQLNVKIKNFELSDNIKFALFLHATELRGINGINYLDELSNKKIHPYLDELMKSDTNIRTSFESLNFQMLLIKSLEINPLTKCLVSFVVGKSLLFSEIFIELINKFNGYKISISYYDDEKQKTILVQYFTEDLNYIKEKIYEITEQKTVEKMKNVIDINSVLEQQYSLFKYFDNEIKKTIIIVSTHSNDSFVYDFNSPDKQLLENLYELGVNIFDYSDRINFVNTTTNNNTNNKIIKNNEKISYNFYNSEKSEYIQFVPYVRYFDMCDNYNTLFNIINKYPIPLNKIQNFYLDLESDEEIIFEFDLKKEKEKLYKNEYIDKYNRLRFIFDPSILYIYFSRVFPYPNMYSYESNFTINSTDKTEVFYDLKELFQDNNNSKFYMSIKAPNKVSNIYVDLELCDDGKKCIKESFYFKFYLGFTAVGFLIFLYGIYICFCEITFKKESNIFDIK